MQAVSEGFTRGRAAEVLLGPDTRRDVRDIATTGLLRDLAGETIAEVARRRRIPASEAVRRHAWHHVLLLRDEPYRERVLALAREILGADEAELAVRVLGGVEVWPDGLANAPDAGAGAATPAVGAKPPGPIGLRASDAGLQLG